MIIKDHFGVLMIFLFRLKIILVNHFFILNNTNLKLNILKNKLNNNKIKIILK